MSKQILEEDEFEWDRNRLVALILIIVIIAGIGWTAIRYYTPPVTVQNVMYTVETDQDASRFNILHQTFFGGDPDFENTTLVIATLLIAEIPDVNRLIISISTQLPTHLTAIVLAEWQNENNVLHGVSSIDSEQVNYAVTINGGNTNLILYLFLENTISGSYEITVRAFNTG